MESLQVYEKKDTCKTNTGGMKMKKNYEVAKVINFQQKRDKKTKGSLTPEQKLKLITLEAMYEGDEATLKEIFDKGLSIDEAFRAFANTLFKEQEKVIRS